MTSHTLLAYRLKTFIILLFLTTTIFSGCTSITNETHFAERPEQWATPVNTDMNLYEIDEGFYRSEQPTQNDLEQIRSLEIKTIISLRGFHSDENVITDPDITLIRVPIHTWNITDKDVIAALDAIQEARLQGPVLLHCLHGADRTGLISAMYRIIYQGWSKEDALAELQHGGYGFHSIWQNIPTYLEDVQIPVIEQQLRFPPFQSIPN